MGVPVRCVWVDTSIEDAQVNAVMRMVRKYGAFLSPDEIKKASRKDPNAFGPSVLFRYRKGFEEPTTTEGFASVERVAFKRSPASPDYTQKALLLDYDGTLRRTKSGDKYPKTPDDIEILPGRRERLLKYKNEGWRLLGVSNQGDVARGRLTIEAARACFERTNELQGSQGAMWVREEGGHPFVFEGLSQVKDGAAMRTAISELGDLFYAKVWGEGRKMMLAQGAPEAQLPVQMQFKDFVALMSTQTSRMGIELALKDAVTRAGSKFDSLEVKIDWARMPLRGELSKVGELVGPDIGIALAGEGTSFASVLGPSAGKRAAVLLDNAVALAAPTDPWLALA